MTPPAFRVLEPDFPEYPPLLADLEEPPPRLWVVGRDLRTLGAGIAVVGARRATAYGLDVARTLAADLAAAGLCVVSGMAKGIDGKAHEGALAACGLTVAVLGTGVDVAYPPANRSLYERIRDRGALVSQFPPGTPPRKKHFPERNRVIAGLCLGVVVVQGAHPGSGSLITAAGAMHLGRPVFAVPGDVRSVLSTGPHQLLLDGARICTGARDVLDEVAPALRRRMALGDHTIPPGLGSEEVAVLLAVSAEPARAEAVAASAGLDAPTALRTLARLEVAGLVGRAPGGAYCRPPGRMVEGSPP